MESTSSMSVVLDIDEVLSCCKPFLPKSTEAFYSKRGFVIEAVRTHHVFPGVIEFLQCLHSLENIHFSFFSSGPLERNLPFVQKLLTQALGDETYRKIQKDVMVLSADDLVESNDEDTSYQHDVYGLVYGKYKKDLNKAKGSSPLKHTVLIDDQPNYVMRGQEKNLIWAPQMEHYLNYGKYDKEGYKKIPCKNIDTEKKSITKFDKEEVMCGRQILVIKNGDSYKIAFLNSETGKYEKKALSPDQNHVMRELVSGHSSCYLGTPEQIAFIHEIVRSFGGKTKVFCMEGNRIYYIAGVFFSALETAQKEELPITEILFRWQFKKKESSFKPIYGFLARQEKFYHIGLKKLQEFNPSLEFITPASLKSLKDK